MRSAAFQPTMVPRSSRVRTFMNVGFAIGPPEMGLLGWDGGQDSCFVVLRFGAGTGASSTSSSGSWELNPGRYIAIQYKSSQVAWGQVHLARVFCPTALGSHGSGPTTDLSEQQQKSTCYM